VEAGGLWGHTQLLHTVVDQLLLLLFVGDGLCLQLAGLWTGARSESSTHIGDGRQVRAEDWNRGKPGPGKLPFSIPPPDTHYALKYRKSL
jgi:hypothetical protein